MCEEEVPLVVIGAGPHALALLLRLVEPTPDLMGEAERSHIMAKAGTRARTHAEVRKHLKKRYDGPAALKGVVVVDLHGSWMEQWQLDFSALEIDHLRSHADLHPCPFDFQSLRVWAEMHKRSEELWHMQYLCRQACRNAGYGGPFVLPSTRLFADFCSSMIARYRLDRLVRKGEVQRINVEEAGGGDGDGARHDDGNDRFTDSGSDGIGCGSDSHNGGRRRSFVLHLADGGKLRATRVVCAMGPGPMFAGMRANMPWWYTQLVVSKPLLRAPFACHASELSRWLAACSGDRDSLLQGKRILVVGGGQTAGHLALLALKHGCESVTLAARRRIVRKPYDVDLSLVGDERGSTLEKFWRMTPTERVRFIADVRGGGSMSHEVYAALLAHCEGERTPLSIHEELEVVRACWRPTDDCGLAAQEDTSELCGGEVHVAFDDGSTCMVDLVWLATGGELDLNLVPIFKSLLEQRPVPVVSGLPVLQPDLSWDSDCPLYVMGAFAQLQLGADALNLAGSRAGSVVIAEALRSELRGSSGQSSDAKRL